MKQEYIRIEKPTEIQISSDDCEILLGGQTITLNKMFGPRIFADLRITPSLEREGWIIERAIGGDFVEWVVIPNQIEMDFDCEECNDRPAIKDEKCRGCLNNL